MRRGARSCPGPWPLTCGVHRSPAREGLRPSVRGESPAVAGRREPGGSGNQGLSAPDLTPGRVDAFVLASRAGGTSGPWARRKSAGLEYLVSLGIEVRPESLSPWSSSSPPTAVTSKTSVGWGLLPSAATCARRGTSSCAAAGVIPPASTTCPPLTSRASSWPKRRAASPRTVNETVVRLRSLLRYFYLLGLIGSLGPGDTVDGQLAGSLPRSFDPSVGARLLAGCERSTLSGAREFAILSVLVRLGLRPGEIAALSCDDIDWRRGEVVVRGKGGVFDVLPLPADVGESLAFYLERRGKVRCRQVFANVEAPWGALTMTAVRAVVRMACARLRHRRHRNPPLPPRRGE